jgi:hypothetical protein
MTVVASSFDMPLLSYNSIISFYTILMVLSEEANKLSKGQDAETHGNRNGNGDGDRDRQTDLFAFQIVVAFPDSVSFGGNNENNKR